MCVRVGTTTDGGGLRRGRRVLSQLVVLASSSAQSVEQRHHGLAAGYRTLPSPPRCFCCNHIITQGDNNVPGHAGGSLAGTLREVCVMSLGEGGGGDQC